MAHRRSAPARPGRGGPRSGRGADQPPTSRGPWLPRNRPQARGSGTSSDRPGPPPFRPAGRRRGGLPGGGSAPSVGIVSRRPEHARALRAGYSPELYQDDGEVKLISILALTGRPQVVSGRGRRRSLGRGGARLCAAMAAALPKSASRRWRRRRPGDGGTCRKKIAPAGKHDEQEAAPPVHLSMDPTARPPAGSAGRVTISANGRGSSPLGSASRRRSRLAEGAGPQRSGRAR